MIDDNTNKHNNKLENEWLENSEFMFINCHPRPYSTLNNIYITNEYLVKNSSQVQEFLISIGYKQITTKEIDVNRTVFIKPILYDPRNYKAIVINLVRDPARVRVLALYLERYGLDNISNLTEDQYYKLIFSVLDPINF